MNIKMAMDVPYPSIHLTLVFHCTARSSATSFAMALRFIPLLAPFLGAVFAAPTELPDTTTATETTSDNGSIIVVTATTGES